MGKTKRIFILVLLVMLCSFVLSINAATGNLYVNGRKITYSDGSDVIINTEFITKGTEFRGVWVSPLTGDITGYSTQAQYKRQIIEVLETMEAYNFNAMIFHVRIMNDALYESEYNSWSSYYNKDPNWDALPWIIEECHKRGIEFHAWMNPYRVTTNVSKSLEDIAKEHKTSNAAHYTDNLLKGSSCVILDPGKQEVRDFLVDTCMELVEKYDVDAIHFDDYFYTKGIDDTNTYIQNNPNGLSIANWRREQINLFIEDLSKNLKDFNNKNNRRVQLGISPTGVYRNGNGVVTYNDGKAISNGSATGGYAHYGDPLYADTIKWIENEWIDYILPQTYHAITNSAAPYCDLVSWWDKMARYSNVNFYASIGLYMHSSSGNASWSSNEKELYQQALFCNSLENIKGNSIYNYLSIIGGDKPTSVMYQMKDVWDTPIILPEIKTYDKLEVDAVSNFSVTKNSKGNLISFDKLDDAKFYVIYRSTNPITFSADEVIDIIGDVSVDNVISYVDPTSSDKYYYGVKAQSYSLSLGEGVSSKVNGEGEELKLANVSNLGISGNLLPNEKVTIYWDELIYPFGDIIDYEITYSFDGIASTTSKYYYKSSKYNVDIVIPNNVESLEVSVKAYNNLGNSVTTYSTNILKKLGDINNFGYIGLPYEDKDLTFVWNSLSNNEIIYAIEYSSDGYSWTTLIDNIKKEESLNIRTTIKPLKGSYSYRVVAKLDDMVSYSEPIKFTTYEYLGDFKTLNVDDISIIKNNGIYEIIKDENDTVKIEWKTLSSKAVYNVMISGDKKNWMTMIAYSSSSSIDKTSSGYIANLDISYMFTTVYVKITASVDYVKTESPIFKINVNKEFLFYDEVISHLTEEQNILLNEMNLFK